MFGLLNKITWFVCILVGLFIFYLEDELFILGIMVAVGLKYIFFSPNYIQECIDSMSVKKSKNVKISGIEQTPVLQKEIEEATPPEQEESEEAKDVAVEEKVTIHPSYVAQSTSQRKEKTEPKKPGVLESFFAENLIAKIGGIILFIGVLTFLIGIYSIIGPVAKITIGFIIGFSLFAVGVFLDKKNYIQESRIVMGISILVNYLVILAGRHFLGDTSTSDATLLSAGVTFFLLILNTIFGIVVSLVYNSRSLLLFAFAVAYINPLLLGTSSDEPYTLLAYTMIVTCGAMFMSYKKEDEILFPISFSLASIMILIAPWSDSTAWVTKLLCVNTLGVMALYTSTIFKKTYKYIYEFLIAGTFFLIGIMGLLGGLELNNIELIIMGASSLALMNFCYFFMQKEGYMYSLGTLGAILTLTPVLATSILAGNNVALCSLIIGIFAISNIGNVLLQSKKLIGDNLGNLMTGLISGALFLGFMVYILGNEYFPGVTQGLAIMGLAAVYGALSFIFVQQVSLNKLKEDVRYQNVFYSIAALAISFFSLAIALVFAENKEVVSIVWLLEASVLFYVTGKLKSLKVGVGALVLFVIGVLQILPFVENAWKHEYGMIATCIIVGASLIINLFILFRGKTNFEAEFYGVHNVFHVIAVAAITTISLVVLDIRNEWLALMYVHTIVTAMIIMYNYISSKGLLYIGYIALVGIYGIHIIANIFALGGGFFGTYEENILFSIIILSLSAVPFIYEYMRYKVIYSKILGAITCLYVLIITSLYVLQLFEVTFALTLYWGILAFSVLTYGIKGDILYMRTLGLYLLSLTVAKIFLYDIWQPGVDDGVGFIAFMLTGALMIALSTMYTKKYGNTLGKDFSPQNLTGKIISKPSHSSDTKNIDNTTSETPLSDNIMEDIQNVNISGIIGVRMRIDGQEKPVQIRAENLIKIAKMITHSYGKTRFAPGELQSVYETITQNYKSELPASQYKRIVEIVKLFVDNGGEIEFVS